MAPTRTTATTVEIEAPAPSGPQITMLDLPGDLYAVKTDPATTVTLISRFDLAAATAANPVTPVWTSPQMVVEGYGLSSSLAQARGLAERILGSIGVSVEPVFEANPDLGRPDLVFEVTLPRSDRGRWFDFVDAYARTVHVPSGAPVPVLNRRYL